MSKKTAMVAPVPAKPLPAQPDFDRKLAEILQMFGNDRPYTVIRRHKNSWKILFLGDYKPTVVRFNNEKPEMDQE